MEDYERIDIYCGVKMDSSCDMIIAIYLRFTLIYFFFFSLYQVIYNNLK